MQIDWPQAKPHWVRIDDGWVFRVGHEWEFYIKDGDRIVFAVTKGIRDAARGQDIAYSIRVNSDDGHVISVKTGPKLIDR